MIKFWPTVSRSWPLPYFSADSRELKHLLRGYAAYRHGESNIIQVRLFLPENTDMIGVLGHALIFSGGR